MKLQIPACSSSRRSHQPMRSSKAMPKWQMLLLQRHDHVRLRKLRRAWSQRSRSVRGTQTVLGRVRNIGKYTHNCTGYAICAGFNSGQCSNSTPGIWCAQQWDTVYQCDHCLGIKTCMLYCLHPVVVLRQGNTRFLFLFVVLCLLSVAC